VERFAQRGSYIATPQEDIAPSVIGFIAVEGLIYASGPVNGVIEAIITKKAPVSRGFEATDLF
jgi:hypothetical protein